MTENQIAEVIEERFGRWGQHLRDEHSTPILLLGLDPAKGQFCLCVCEETTDDQVLELVESAAAMLRRNHRVKRPKR
jgi:hypothetical protein